MCLWKDHRWELDAEDPVREMLDCYLESGGDLNFVHPRNGWTFLHLAVEYGNATAICKLLQLGMDINLGECPGGLPLHFAVDSAVDCAIQDNRDVDWSMVKLLVELGADRKCLDDEGRNFWRFVLYRCGPIRAAELARVLNLNYELDYEIRSVDGVK